MSKLELECDCHGHRIFFEKDEDGLVYIAITEIKRGRPKWVEVVLRKEKVKKVIKFLNT